MLCAGGYIFNLLYAFNCLQPMKKFVFSVASRATGRLQIKLRGSGDENGTNRTLACSARAQDISVCVECVECVKWISGLQQSTFRGARSDSKLLAIYRRWKHTNTNECKRCWWLAHSLKDGKSTFWKWYSSWTVLFERPIYKRTLPSESLTGNLACTVSDLPTELEAG